MYAPDFTLQIQTGNKQIHPASITHQVATYMCVTRPEKTWSYLHVNFDLIFSLSTFFLDVF